MTNFLDNHKQKCRCCFQNFTEENQKVKITKKICRNFLAVVQIKLQMSSSYSNFLCELCHNQLEKFVQFKTEAFEKQTQLYKLLETKRKTRLNCEYIEPLSESFVMIKDEIKEEIDEYEIGDCSISIETFPFAEEFENLENEEIKSESSEEDLIAKAFRELPKLKRPKAKKKLCKIKKKGFKQCQHCGTYVANLKSHLRQVHLKLKKHFCDICGYGHWRKSKLGEHMFRHLSREEKLEIKGIACEICGVKFLGKNSLNKHILSQHVDSDEKESFECHCGKVYKNKSSLTAHQRMTHQERPQLPCKYCDKTFNQLSYLQMHEKRHQRGGLKEFACNACNKLFATQQCLRNHMLLHSQPTFACDQCDKVFHLKNVLKTHIKAKHEDEVFCEFCAKKMSSLAINRHVKEFHSGLKKQKCVIFGCENSFLRKHQMQEHIKQCHGEYLEDLSENQRKEVDKELKKISKLMV